MRVAWCALRILGCVAATVLVSRCGPLGPDDPPGAPENTSYIVPEYRGQVFSDSSRHSSQPVITQTVVDNQDRGEALTALLNRNGRIRLGFDTWVQLTRIPHNTCPDGVQGCDITDSDSLGIGPGSMTASMDSIVATIRNQGERGTCLAFALNGAAELLLRRQGPAGDLSEQYTYFISKKLTQSWNDAGLNPVGVFSAFADTSVTIPRESTWPYNPNEYACSSYHETHPGYTCSATEAQGGGEDNMQPDPKTEEAPGVRIAEIHQLYASLGRVKQALYRGYPVILSINANADFTVATFKGGVVSWVFKIDGCGTGVCGHAVTAVGYQDDPSVDGGGYLIVKNSWGDSWGDRGMGYCTYEWVEHSLLDAQAVVRVARE